MIKKVTRTICIAAAIAICPAFYGLSGGSVYGMAGAQDQKAGPKKEMKESGTQVGKGGKSLAHNVKHGHIARGGKHFGKHMGSAGKHFGKGTARGVKKAVKP
jgi:hypothetical protein